MVSKYHVNNDGGTNEWCHRVKGNHPTLARQETEQVTDQCHHSPAKHGGRQELTVIVCSEQQTCQMRDSQSDKSHRTTEGCGNSCQQARHYQQPVSDSDDINILEINELD